MSGIDNFRDKGGKIILPKLPYGVLEDADKPVGFVPSEYPIQLAPAETTDDGASEGPGFAITCQPSVPNDATFSSHPDKWTECLVEPSIKRKILSTPGYPEPLNRPPEQRHRIGQSPYGGLGVFATVNLKTGDLIFSERAIMILSQKTPYQVGSIPSHFTTAQIQQAALAQKEKFVEAVFERLQEENKAAFMALHNSHKQDGSGPLMGVVRTNGFGIDLYDDDDNEGEKQFPYVGIWNEGSRLNHSCRPNVQRHFNFVTFGMEFHAARSINAGEELVTHYSDLFISMTGRQEQLKPYGFICRCKSCTTAPHSDLVQWRLQRNLPKLAGYKRLAVFLMTPMLSEDYVVKYSLEQLNMIESAGLEVSRWYLTHLRFIVEVYCAAGDASNAVIYSRKAEAAQRAVSGGEENSTTTLLAMVKGHPRWNYKKTVQAAMEAAGIGA
ncbi:SET domain-containing protein [Marasmius fiardii PR-910]|nr:SET domain-containing protein [Marasmius fiardii PR-910]